MKVIKNCIVCKKEFISYDVGRRKQNIFCSVACKSISQRIIKVPRIEFFCKTCSKVFLQRPKGTKIFCSKKCQHKSLQKLRFLNDEEKIKKLKQSYEKFVIKNPDGCWEWIGATNKRYGCFNFFNKAFGAHRASWIIHHGNIPIGKHVLHKCDNPPCTNPSHLFIGTHYDNMKDMRDKGYHRQSSKLTANQVKEIKNLLKTTMTQKEIAEIYRVSFVTIHDIKYEKTWKKA